MIIGGESKWGRIVTHNFIIPKITIMHALGFYTYFYIFHLLVLILHFKIIIIIGELFLIIHINIISLFLIFPHMDL